MALGRLLSELGAAVGVALNVGDERRTAISDQKYSAVQLAKTDLSPFSIMILQSLFAISTVWCASLAVALLSLGAKARGAAARIHGVCPLAPASATSLGLARFGPT